MRDIPLVAPGFQIPRAIKNPPSDAHITALANAAVQALGLFNAVKAVTTADLTSASVTPIVIVPDANVGAGKVLIPIRLHWRGIKTAPAWTNGSTTMTWRYRNGATKTAISTIMPFNLNTATSGMAECIGAPNAPLNLNSLSTDIAGVGVELISAAALSAGAITSGEFSLVYALVPA